MFEPRGLPALGRGLDELAGGLGALVQVPNYNIVMMIIITNFNIVCYVML